LVKIVSPIVAHPTPRGHASNKLDFLVYYVRKLSRKFQLSGPVILEEKILK
jgi:hypothetical protein